MTFPPESLVQILNNFTESFDMMASTKSVKTVLLGLIQLTVNQGVLNPNTPENTFLLHFENTCNRFDKTLVF